MILDAFSDGIRVLQILRTENRRKRRQRKLARLSLQQLEREIMESSSSSSSSSAPNRDALQQELTNGGFPVQPPSEWSTDEESAEMEASAEYYGTTPPASTSAIVNLVHLRLQEVPTPEPTDDNTDDNNACNDLSCVICSENLQTSEVVTVLPCGHMFHSTCVVPWLAHRCTCPNCRYELQTDCEEFEEGREHRMKGRKMQQTELGDADETSTQSASKTQQQQQICHFDTSVCMPLGGDNEEDLDETSVSTASSLAPLAGCATTEITELDDVKKVDSGSNASNEKTKTLRAWCGSVVVRLTMEA